MTTSLVTISELAQQDLPFLLSLWHNPEVMRYADEFPGLRGWSRDNDANAAWEIYQERRARLGKAYTQLMLRLQDGTLIGESFFAPLRENATFGKWVKPDGITCFLGDIKLEPAYWGRGLGTAGMRQVVRFAFWEAGCELFVVPPHRQNPAASRVYEKAGFVRFTGMRSWRNHRIMEMSKEQYRTVYEGATSHG